jgi:Protein of unknown function (DUF3237)
MTEISYADLPMNPPSLGLEFAFRIRLTLGIRQKIGEIPSGGIRGFVSAAGGIIEGPMLQGRVVPNSGGDWALYRPDNTVMFHAHYMLEATDGTQIYMRNNGYRHAPPEVASKQEALIEVGFDEYYMRLSPTFDTPIGSHDWLTRHVIVGCGERHAEYSVFHYYLLR